MLCLAGRPVSAPQCRYAAAALHLLSAVPPHANSARRVVRAQVFGAEGDANYDADAIYHVRRVVSVGCYAGGRAQMAQTHEPAFDDELTEREGYGVHLGPKGGVYAGYWQDGARSHVPLGKGRRQL
eukprot:6211065-Pleurochrysis_carterae.AAC.1